MTAVAQGDIRALQQEARRAGAEGVWRERDELVERFRGEGTPEAGDDSEFAQAYLRLHGVRTEPALTNAEPGSEVRVRYGNRLALEAAIAATLVLAIPALAAYWAYGAVLLGLGAVAVGALLWFWHRLDRGLPRWLPRGRVTGLAVTLPLLLVVGGAICLVIRHNRTGTINTREASALLRQADLALDHGDVDGARALLFRAEGVAKGKLPEFAADVRGHLVVKQFEGLLAEQDRKVGIYDEAVRAGEAGQTAQAVKLLKSIAGFRDADSLARKYQRAGR
jgi:hypothetical protein